MRSTLLRLVFSFSLLSSFPSTAETVTYGWTGSIDLVSPAFAGLIDNGDPFIVTVEVDLDAVDNAPSPDYGNYGNGTIIGFSLLIDGSFYVNASGGEVAVLDEYSYFSSYQDVLQPFVSDASYFTTWTNVPGFAPQNAQINLRNTGSANSGPFTSDDLPTYTPNPSDFNDLASMTIYFLSEQDGGVAQGSITGVFPVTTGSAATIDLNGSVSLSTLGEVIFTTPALQQARTYLNINSGSAAANAISGFTSLAGVPPANLTTSFGDLETLSTTYTPNGCTPVAGDPSANCATAIITRGDNDGSTVPYNLSLAGVGTILTGEFISLTTTVITDIASPNFAAGTTVGQIQILGGQEPYLSEAFALTGGTGRIDFVSVPTSPSCGTATCVQNTASTLTFAPPPPVVPALAPMGLVVLALGAMAVPLLFSRSRSARIGLQ